jgi:hypothetical protein
MMTELPDISAASPWVDAQGRPTTTFNTLFKQMQAEVRALRAALVALDIRITELES